MLHTVLHSNGLQKNAVHALVVTVSRIQPLSQQCATEQNFGNQPSLDFVAKSGACVFGYSLAIDTGASRQSFL